MKKIVVCAFLLAVAFQGVKAQNESGEKCDGHRSRHHKESFESKLNLSEDQKAKFKSLNEDFHKQIQELKKNEDITVKESKSRMETLRNDHRSKIQGLLTTDQKSQLQKMKEDRKIKHAADAQARMEKMKTRLGLTDDQAAKMKQSRTEMSAKMKTIREDKSLTDEQRKEQVKALMQKHKESLKSILSDEQIKKLHEKQTRRSAKQPA
jgi:hypothetical protein